MFSRHLAASVKFSIDTVAPAVTITSPSSPDALGEARVRFAATLNEPARAQLTLDGKLVSLGGEQATDGAAATSGLTQSVSADVEVTDGAHQFALVATDQAGNSSTTRLAAWADLDAPVVAAASWPDGDWKKPSASVAFKVTDDFPDKVKVSATIDGSAVTPEPAAGTSATGTSAAGTTAAAAGTTSPAGTTTAAASTSAAATYNLSTGDLAEGSHTLSFTAVDGAGHSSTWTRSFVVNSTEAFGARPIGPGAKGKDVTALQQILAGRGFYKGKASGTFDDATAAAVAAYEAGQASAGGTVRAQTVVDLDMQKQLLGSIRIVLSERKLYFSRDGSLFKTYSVAVGQPAYPTPTGSFKIISKVVDPTWTPPDSPWAAGAVPIGPGPDDPLGTRWMGLSAPSVGIHGTYASSSIGTAASHGCVRMLLHQAEELFDLVFVGTPVEIVP